MDRIAPGAVVEDAALRAPGAVRAGRRVADLLRGPARDLDLLQLPLGEETEEPAVGGPEGPRRPLRARQRLSSEGVQGADPDLRLPLRVRRVEGDVAPVGRDAGRADRDDALRDRDLETDRARFHGRAAYEAVGETRRREQRDRRNAPRETLAALAPCGDRRGHARLRAAFRYPLELELDVVGRLEPVLRVLGEAGLDDAVQRRREHRRDLGHGDRVVAE